MNYLTNRLHNWGSPLILAQRGRSTHSLENHLENEGSWHLLPLENVDYKFVHFLVGETFSLENDGVQVQRSYPQHVSNMFQQLLTGGYGVVSSAPKCLKRKTISRKWRGTTPNSTPLLSLETPGFLLQKSYTEALSWERRVLESQVWLLWVSTNHRVSGLAFLGPCLAQAKASVWHFPAGKQGSLEHGGVQPQTQHNSFL